MTIHPPKCLLFRRCLMSRLSSLDMYLRCQSTEKRYLIRVSSVGGKGVKSGVVVVLNIDIDNDATSMHLSIGDIICYYLQYHQVIRFYWNNYTVTQHTAHSVRRSGTEVGAPRGIS